MNSFCIEIVSETASFRNPEFQNYHKTLNLPPPSTIIGLTGAAMGLSALMAQQFFDDHEIEIGIAGYHEGKMKDTWKYNKRSSAMHLYDPLLDGSIVKREHLIKNLFLIVFASDNELAINKLKDSFENPTFALTMGNSDALAKMKVIHDDLTITEDRKISNCLLAGDAIGEVLKQAGKNPVFSIYQSSEPIKFDLPVRFDYKSDYGKRSIAKVSTFSFVTMEMQLNYNVRGVNCQNLFIPIFKL